MCKCIRLHMCILHPWITHFTRGSFSWQQNIINCTWYKRILHIFYVLHCAAVFNRIQRISAYLYRMVHVYNASQKYDSRGKLQCIPRVREWSFLSKNDSRHLMHLHTQDITHPGLIKEFITRRNIIESERTKGFFFFFFCKECDDG